MNAVELIAKKRDGQALTQGEIAYFLSQALQGEIPDYQVSALLMAGRIRGFTRQETIDLTLAMAHSGEMLDLSAIPGVKADKHSTGGVGDKTSLLVMPIVAAAGLVGAKMSGRGLGHTGGTLDKLEAIPGFRTALSPAQFISQLQRIGLAIIGQTADLAPADQLLYSLRDVTATVDSIPLIAASIMSKKLAMGADVLVLDVKYGSGALIREQEKSRELARLMVEVAKGAGIRASAMLSAMAEPLGWAVGNALEIREVWETLNNRGPADLRQVALALAGELICLSGLRPDRESSLALAQEQLASGAAKAKFLAMVTAQGGSTDWEALPQARYKVPYPAAKAGCILDFRLKEVGLAALALGAGREKKTDQIAPGAGLVFRAKIGRRVAAGEVLAEIHGDDPQRISQAKAILDDCILIGEGEPRPEPLIAEIISA